jgi:hypothetical protein
MNKTKAARSSGNYSRANVHGHKDSPIISNFEFGSLLAGIIIAVSFGLMFIHAAVAL